MKNILTREEFVDFFKKKEERERKYTELDVAFEAAYPEASMFNPHIEENIPLDILKRMFLDDGDWIGYFCCELNYGKNWGTEPRQYTGYDENNNPIPMRDAGELYDFLVKEMKEKSEE